MQKLTTGNKGEWSEFYSFLKILSERVLTSADADLSPLPGLDIPVLKVYRNETGFNEKVYELPKAFPKIINFSQHGKGNISLNSDEITSKLKTIFSKINKGSAIMSEGVYLMSFLNCTHLRGRPAGSKDDIDLTIHNPRTGQEPRVAYSIKSQVGSPSTLLNASGATNFLYEIILPGKSLNLDDVNKLTSTKSRIIKLLNSNAKLKYVETSSSIFSQNLELIDTRFPELMSILLERNFSSSFSTLVDTVNSFGDYFELPKSGFKMTKIQAIYKIKHFLAAVALGMTPSRLWDGNLSATGGYLILKTNGDLVCFHSYNIDKFKDYLYNSTKFEHASETRHGYGQIFNKGSGKYIRLNLQIRFTK